MASVPRVRWAQNGVFLPGRSFSGKRNEKFAVTDHKPSQQRIQGHRLIVSAAAKTAGRGRDTDSELSGLDRLILYDRRTCDDWTTGIGDVRRKKSVDDAKAGDNSEKFDEWMTDSVVEIVSNIGEAPFLFHIHADDDQTGSQSNASVKFVREKAVADSWPLIKERWKKGGSPIPNGVILVEELQNNEIIVSPNEEEEEDIINNNQLQYSTTKTWGVLIQAKGANSTACYILKTCRVETFLGGFCTHFYLVRAKCFVESAETQLKKMWLQR